MPDDARATPPGPDVGFDSLRTERLVLRRFTLDDAESFAAYRSDPETARYQGWDAPYSDAQAREFIQALGRTDPDTPGEWFQLAVVLASSAELIGDVAVSVDAAEPSLATIGFTLATGFRGRGFAMEAVGALLGYLFESRHKHRVVAECDPRNLASASLLERVGMRLEAHHVASARWKGEWTDELVFAMLSNEWQPDRRAAAGRD